MLSSSFASVMAVPVMPQSFGKLRNNAWYVTCAITWLCLDTVMPFFSDRSSIKRAATTKGGVGITPGLRAFLHQSSIRTAKRANNRKHGAIYTPGLPSLPSNALPCNNKAYRTCFYLSWPLIELQGQASTKLLLRAAASNQFPTYLPWLRCTGGGRRCTACPRGPCR